MSSDPHFHLRYPIGPQPYTTEWQSIDLSDCIDRIERLPGELCALVEGLSTTDLQKQYRDGSWTVAQLVHHISDSHMNAHVRTRWCLTENSPVIKAYNENDWSELADYNLELIDNTLQLITALHKRWTYLLRELNEEQWGLIWIHPDLETPERRLAHIAEIYSWHGEHHLAHIKLALQSG